MSDSRSAIDSMIQFVSAVGPVHAVPALLGCAYSLIYIIVLYATNFGRGWAVLRERISNRNPGAIIYLVCYSWPFFLMLSVWMHSPKE